MRIAMMTNNYLPYMGGVPVSVARLSSGLRSLGHEVVVFAPAYRQIGQERDVIRYRALQTRLWEGIAVPDMLDPRIEREFQKRRFDVIHVHHPLLMGQAAAHLSRKYGIPLVFTYHTRYEQYLHYVGLSGLKGILPPFLRNFCNGCQGVIAPTQSMKSYLERIGVKTPVAILPTGIQNGRFRVDREERKAVRKRLLPKGGHLFLCVARLAKEKNLPFLLASLALYRKRTKDDFRFALIGEGPEKENLKVLAKRLGISDRVLFLGRVENEAIPGYYAAADLFLFSSTTETQGIVSLEAMAAGTPVLAVSATGTKDLVVNGKNGYLTEERPEVFCEKLCQILSPGELPALREGAKKTAQRYEELEVAHAAVLCYQAAGKRMENGKRKGQEDGGIRAVFGTF